MNSSMVNSKFFIFTLVLSFLFIIIALNKQRQLDQLKSRVSLLESSTEKKDHELRSKEIFEKEIASLKDKIDSIQDLSDTSWSGNKEQLKEWIPIVKNQSLRFTSYAKPLFDFLTAKTIEAYHVSKKTLVSLLVKFLRSAIPFMQELYMSAMPYFDQTASVTKISLETLGSLFKKISTFLLTILMERLNDLYHWCMNLEVAA